jgi:hypothetical protein
MAAALEQAIENIYVSLNNNNEDIDLRIAELKAAAKEAGVKEVTFKPDRLVQPNREGRLMMKSYFKKRGVAVTFEK